MDEGGGEYESSNFHVCADNIPPFRIPAIPAFPINFNDSISKGRIKLHAIIIVKGDHDEARH